MGDHEGVRYRRGGHQRGDPSGDDGCHATTHRVDRDAKRGGDRQSRPVQFLQPRLFAPASGPVTSPNAAHGGLKDTPRNILDTGEFTVNVVTEAVLEPMDETSREVPPDVSEFDLAGVERAPSSAVALPRVADAVLTEGKIDATQLATVGRLGGPYYTDSEPLSFERSYW